MLVEIVGGNRISVGASYVEKEAVKNIPGSRWKDNEWTVPLTWAACLALRGTFGDRLEVGPSLTAWSHEEYAKRVKPCLDLRMAVSTDNVWDARLRPFQQAGVEWMLTSSDGALLGDDVGAGKMVQTCVALRHLGVKRGIVVAPKSVLPAWRDHLKEWADLRGVIITGSAAKRRAAIQRVKDGEADVAILTWENLRAHTKLAHYGGVVPTDEDKRPKELNDLDHEFVVADEAQKSKDPRSKMARALWAIGDVARVRYATTATPMDKDFGELWSVMRFVSPEEWPVKTKFIDRYCDMTWNRWGGMEVGGVKPATAAELFGFLDPRFRAMPKSLVLPDLPPVSGGILSPEGPMFRYAEMGAKQAKAYAQMLKESVADLDSGRLVALGAMQRAGRLMQLASAYGEITETVDPETQVVSQTLTLMEPSCKLDVLEEMLLGELSAEPAIVVFTVSRQLARLAAERIKKVLDRPVGLIIGGQAGWEREEVITKFQGGALAAVVATVQAGGAGITLTKSRVEVFLQRDFSYIGNYQAEGRVHRIGSEIHDRVLYYDVVTPDSPDERVVEVLRAKGSITEELTRPEELRWLLTGKGDNPLINASEDNGMIPQ